jgi:hypothetical protein
VANTNSTQKQEWIAQSKLPPKKAHLEALGKYKDKVLHSQVLVMGYTPAERTKGGIILTARARDEDRFQGKIGLVVAMGPGAFKDDAIAKFKMAATMYPSIRWVMAHTNASTRSGE